MKLADAIELLQHHYQDNHIYNRPCGYTIKHIVVTEDLFLNRTRDWIEEDRQEASIDIVSVHCGECDQKMFKLDYP